MALRLGIALDEDVDDWMSLAPEATRVLLVVSKEWSRLEQGVHHVPTEPFR